MDIMAEEDGWFKPDRLVALYDIYLAIVFAVFFLPAIAGLFFAGILPGIAATVVSLVILGFAVWWIRAFYRTSFYRLTDDDIEHRRGVWFKSTTEVPYNRITNVDSQQGPIQRYVDSGAVKIQTAGSSAQSGAELRISGIENYEDIQQAVVDRVKAKKASGGTETYDDPDTETGTQAQILHELQRIRELLEQK